MADQRTMVIRTDDDAKSWVWSEMQQGRLRQGWGVSGLELTRNGEPVGVEEWKDHYVAAFGSQWAIGPNEPTTRYRILRKMLDLDVGDVVVVPKMPEFGQFSVARVSGKYSYQGTSRLDYGHVIPIEVTSLKPWPYSASPETRLIVKKFRAYQSAVNNVWDPEFITAANSAMQSDAKPIEKDILGIFEEMKGEHLGPFLARMQALTAADLEELVRSAFEEAGLRFVRKHYYDREGGDADSVFAARLPLISDVFDTDLTVFVQVKHKKGQDWEDTQGVEQLARIAAGNPQSIKVLASTADDFTEACQNRAQEEGVLLLSGTDLAAVLLKYL